MAAIRDMVEEDTRRALEAATSSGAMERGARMARRMIRSRTARGIDRFGKQFAPYAESTAKKKGRFSPVTLRETGQMLGSLSIRSGEGNAGAPFDPRAGRFRSRETGQFVSAEDVTFGASVFIKGSRNRRIARYHMFGAPANNLPSRKWFGLTPPEEQRVSQVIGSELRGAIDRVVPDDRRRRIELKMFE